MLKSELLVLLIVLVFGVFAIANIFYHWVFYSAPQVMLMLGTAAYSIWQHKRNNNSN